MITRSRAEGVQSRRTALWGGFTAACAAALCAGASSPSADPIGAAAATPPYVLTGSVSLPGGDKITSFDISFVNPVLNRYFLANRTSKALIGIDTTTNAVVINAKPGFAGAVGVPVNNDISGPDGVLTVDNKEIWVGDAPARVWVLDINTGAVVGGFTNPISTSPQPSGSPSVKRADEMCYDPVDKIVMAANNADDPPYVTFISTTTHTVLGKLAFDGNNGTPKSSNGAEQCSWNQRDGKFYITVPEVNGPGDNSSPGAVVRIDPVTRTVLSFVLIPTASCTGPQGSAIGPGQQIGLGCNVSPTAANNAIIADGTGSLAFGTVIANFPNQGGCDMVWYNPGNNSYMAACRQAPGGEAVFVINAADFSVQRLFSGTLSNAHSNAADPVFNKLFVPTSSAATSGLCGSQGGVDANGCILLFTPAPSQTSVFAAVAPNARTGTVGSTETAFAAIINAGTSNATACLLAPPANFQGSFSFQTTNAANTPTGVPNTPANIPPGGTQNYFFALSPATVARDRVLLSFNCANANPAPFYFGLNTFLLAATAGAIPDVIVGVVTPTQDGNVVLPAFGGTITGQPAPNQNFLAGSAINIGVAGNVTFTPTDTPFGQFPRTLPLTFSICQTDARGTCLASPTASITVSMANNQIITFSVFVTRLAQSIPYVPAINRAFVVATQAGTPVGENSAAVKEP